MTKSLAAALAAAVLAFSPGLKAQDYPSKPIRMVVGFPPGGLVDVVGRQLTQKMSESMGQPIIIDNRGGAGGPIAPEPLPPAPPPGHTALPAVGTPPAKPPHYKNPPHPT